MINDFIKQRRLELGLNQKQLAKKAKVSQSLVSKIENEEVETSFKTVIKLLTALKIEIELRDIR